MQKCFASYIKKSYSGELMSTKEGRFFLIPRSDLTKYKLDSGFEDMIRIFKYLVSHHLRLNII